MGGAGSIQAMNSSLASNRALLNKKRLKDNAYLNADIVKRKGKADYQELKAWRLRRSRQRARSRWYVVVIAILAVTVLAVLSWQSILP